jgi:hypothetical protein
MPFSQEQLNAIIAAIQARAPLQRCPYCHQQQWTCANGIVQVALLPTPQAFAFTGSKIPCVALVCNTCGDLRLVSLLTIGLGHFVGVPGVISG